MIMRYLLCIRYITTFCLMSLFIPVCGCKKQSDDIYTTVSLRAQMPDGRNIVRMEVDETLAGSFIRNLNTRMDYDFPLFVNGEGTVKLLKGVYLISFDATATFSNGKHKRVRYSRSSSPEKALNLLNDNEIVVLKLMELE